MRLIEIGDGQKSIKVSNTYYSNFADDGSIVIYDPENDIATIRISVLTIAPQDELVKDAMFHKVKEMANERTLEAFIVNDKCYYYYSEDNQEDQIRNYFFEIGYRNNIIILTITLEMEVCNTQPKAVEKIITEFKSFISTIEEIDLKQSNIFEPKYTDFNNINQSIAAVLQIPEASINEYHEMDNTLSIIQSHIDNKTFSNENIQDWHNLGLAFGDYLQYKYPDFHWAIMRDEYGRDYCLQYKLFTIVIYPMTMISKRIEDGETLNIFKFLEDLLRQIKDLETSDNYPSLDHND